MDFFPHPRINAPSASIFFITISLSLEFGKSKAQTVPCLGHLTLDLDFQFEGQVILTKDNFHFWMPCQLIFFFDNF